MRRIRRILERKRKWRSGWKWDAMHDRFVKDVDALQASNLRGEMMKPFILSLIVSMCWRPPLSAR
jgi:hypothetical protein